MKTGTLWVVAGGTGGHLYPGIAVAQTLRDRAEQWNARWFTRFIVKEGDYGRDALLREGFDVVEIRGQALPRQLSTAAWRFPWMLRRSWQDADALLGKGQPDLVLGMGGYLSFSVLWAAAARRIPTLIHEQNAVPGVANRVLSWRVQSVAVSFPDSAVRFPRRKVWVSGLPVRSFAKISPESARTALGLDPDLPTFLLFGGSLGASRLNEVFIGVWKKLQERGMRFQVLHVAGRRTFSQFEEPFRQTGVRGRLVDYCHDMANAYGAADLVISRAGASTVAELAAMERPSILIPYPHATADHQWFNAQILARRGMAVVLREEQLEENAMAGRLSECLQPGRLRDWRERCAWGELSAFSRDAAVTLAKYVVNKGGISF